MHDDQIAEDLKAIRAELHHALHGNGRTGLYTIIDDVYGPKDRRRAGLIERVATLEANERAAIAQRKETRYMQRGIAIGMTLVIVETVVGVNLTGFIRAMLGG